MFLFTLYSQYNRHSFTTSAEGPYGCGTTFYAGVGQHGSHSAWISATTFIYYRSRMIVHHKNECITIVVGNITLPQRQMAYFEGAWGWVWGDNNAAAMGGYHQHGYGLHYWCGITISTNVWVAAYHSGSAMVKGGWLAVFGSWFYGWYIGISTNGQYEHEIKNLRGGYF